MRAIVIAVVAVLTLAAIHHPEARIRDDDGRAGTVVDRQGIAFVQAAGRTRWTPLGRHEPLLSGDAIRTDLRGANAVEIELAGGGHLLLGPDTRLEIGNRSVHLLRGECELDPGKTPVTLSGPGGTSLAITERRVLRATAKATETLTTDPRWLTGYRNSTTSEWMGSLVAKVDGRDVPLAIREHRVDVTIRDSVAETTIDQVYSNGTPSILEGVFTFPLPPGASISGFSMWIGSEQVEADIVERSRARQIYEDLKRRKVDPGLLEWSGGNLFTARVWPIPAHGEKRVRVRYTQLLPLEGTTLHWATALRSEAMRAQPVRKVHIHAEVASSRKLTKVSSPTHEVSAKSTERSATIDWDAQEFTPDRDFELRVELAETAPLTIVDHVRDGEGYFAAMITPPGEATGWTRPATPEGKSIELVLVCDTSGSMDAHARQAQREVVAALLGSLGKDDHFRLLGSDYQAAWFDAGAVPADEAHVADALAFLDARPSLGWTDLDLAFRTAVDVAGKGAVVVYVGDGMVTRGDADGPAFARRCNELFAGRDVTINAVAVSNAIDSQVLDAITRAGHGSYVDSGDDVATAALAILSDALGPKLQDVRVSFEKLDVARVYPEVLPNVTLGRERIVVGRFLASSNPQEGRVVVEGTLAGKPVRYVRDCTLGAGDPMHSYLPRLWAQRHIEKLIADGLSPQSRSDVIALSAEYQVMTPLTSFLVLESDADRERYGVTRQIKMRDGEAFFAQARDQARADRMRAALADAARWRVALRQSALREIADLGRSQSVVPVAYGQTRYRGVSDTLAPMGKAAAPTSESLGRLAESRLEFSDLSGSAAEGLETFTGADAAGEDEKLGDLGFAKDEAGLESAEAPEEKNAAYDIDRDDALPGLTMRKVAYGRRSSRANQQSSGSSFAWYPDSSRPALGTFGFPALGAWDGAPIDGPDPDWPAESIAALRALDKREALRALDGIALERTQTMQHAATGRVLERTRRRTVWAKAGWIVRSDDGREAQTRISLLLDGSRRELALALGLGRQRDAADGESAAFAVDLPAGASTDLPRNYRDRTATILSSSDDSLVIELRSIADENSRTVITVDRKNTVLRSMVSYQAERRLGDTTVESTIEIAGVVLPGRVVTHDESGRTVSIEVVSGERLDRSGFETRSASLRDGEQGALILAARDPELVASREAEHLGSASLHQRLAVLVDLLSRDRPAQATALWSTLRPQLGEMRAARWLDLDVISRTRRGEEFLAAAGAAADALHEMPPVADTFFLVHRLTDLATQVLGIHERIALNERVRSALATDGEDADAKDRDIDWRLADAELVRQGGDVDRSMGSLIALADRAPWHLGVQTSLANWSQTAGDHDRARQIYERAIAADSLWTRGELDSLFSSLCSLKWSLLDLAGVRAVAERWIAAGTASSTAFAMRLAAMTYRGELAAVLKDVDATIDAELDLVNKPADIARLDAAIQFLIGGGHGVHRWNVLVEDLPRVDRLARKLIQTRAGSLRAATIFGNDSFRRSDTGRALVAEIVGWLGQPSRVEKMPFFQLDGALQLLDAKDLSDTAWPMLADNLWKRRVATSNRGERDLLANRFLALCDRRDDKERAIAAQRQRLLEPQEKDSLATIAPDLLRRLGQLPWNQEREDEMLGLCATCVDPRATAGSRLQVFAAMMRQTADELLRLRLAHELGPIDDLEKLARKERRAKELAADTAVRRALAVHLVSHVDTVEPEFRKFVGVEAMCFAAESFEDRETVRLQAVLGLDTLANAPQDDPTIILAQRRVSLVLAHICVRRGAPAELVDSVLATYEARSVSAPGELDWHAETARLLTALDRDDALIAALGRWIAPSRIDQHWRTIRGWLLASRGEFQGARADLDRVAQDSELTASEWSALAGWRLVTGDESGWVAANRARFEAIDEWSLRQIVQIEANRLRSKPEAIDPMVIEAARAMLAKASNVQWMLRAVDELYAASKDPRVLGTIGNAVTGRTPERVYQAIAAMRDTLEGVHEEAALDELDADLHRTLGSAKTATDRRAIALALYMCQSRAARVQNGKGDHRRAMIAALQDVARSVGEHLVTGERSELAQVLTGLGALPGEEERVIRHTILETLRAGLPRGSLEDLVVSTFLARVEWTDGARDRALDTMRSVLRRSEEDAGNALPEQALAHADVLIDWLKESGRHTEAETRLVRWRDGQPTPWRRDQFEDRLDQVYASALGSRATTSLGSGAALFDAASKRLESRLSVRAAGNIRIQAILNLYSALCRTAFHAKVGDPARKLSDFAATGLGNLLALAPNQYADLLYVVADTLDGVDASKSGLRLLVGHCLTPPSWNARVGVDLWNRFDWQIANMRLKVRDLGDLHADLRALVLRELEKDLVAIGNNSVPIWRRTDSRYWAELESDYRAVAGKVLELHPKEPAIVTYTARFLHDSLGDVRAGVRALESLDRAGILALDHRDILASWLMDLREFDAALPHLKTLIAAQPVRLDHHLLLIAALGNTRQLDAARIALSAALERFEDARALSPDVEASLAIAARDAGLFPEALEHIGNAVHARERLRRPGVDAALSSWYSVYAEMLSRAERHDEAVEAAGASIVCCGEDQDLRKQRYIDLKNTLGRIKDLEVWIARWDARVAKDGTDAPVVRKALAIVLGDEGLFEAAAIQLRAAIALDPRDVDAHRDLVATLDRLGKRKEAVAAAFGAQAAAPGNLDLIAALAERLESNGRPDDAERAWSDLVEHAPQEADGHRRLAEQRSRQKRDADAVEQWQQVVRTRPDDAEGHLSLLAAQIRAKDKAGAQATIGLILARDWGEGSAEIKRRASDLLR